MGWTKREKESLEQQQISHIVDGWSEAHHLRVQTPLCSGVTPPHRLIEDFPKSMGLLTHWRPLFEWNTQVAVLDTGFCETATTDDKVAQTLARSTKRGVPRRRREHRRKEGHDL